MKIQDILFVLVFLVLLLRRNPKLIVAAGLVCLVLSIPLFAFWVFFTAQRFVYYAAAFFLAAIIIYLVPKRK